MVILSDPLVMPKLQLGFEATLRECPEGSCRPFGGWSCGYVGLANLS